MQEDKQLYRAIIWKQDSSQPGEHVSVLADDLDDAKNLLEKKYGKGTVFNLHNEEDANNPR